MVAWLGVFDCLLLFNLWGKVFCSQFSRRYVGKGNEGVRERDMDVMWAYPNGSVSVSFLSHLLLETK